MSPPPHSILFLQVFLRKNAHDFLEMIRSQRITSAAVTLQRVARGFVYRRVFFATKHALLLIQRMSRGMLVSLSLSLSRSRLWMDACVVYSSTSC